MRVGLWTIPGSKHGVARMNLAKSYPPPPGGSPGPPAISRCDYGGFPAHAASPTVNFPSIKGAGPTTPRHDRAKTSFCSATYGPKWHPAIYRDISACPLLNSCGSVQYARFNCDTWVRLVILRFTGHSGAEYPVLLAILA